MEMMMSKKQLVAFMIVALVITSQEMGGKLAGAKTCDTAFYKCVEKCYKRGLCNACCSRLGYLGGKCDWLRGMACLCCHEDHNGGGSSSLLRLPVEPPGP